MRIGVDKSTFSAIVNNKTAPSFETLYEIVEELRKKNHDIKDIWVK
ncbi:helix-turn-helix transcriptional regulator [Bacillus methanolicus]